MPVLLEFNVGGEDSKAGWLANQSDDWPQLVEIVEQVAEFPFLDIRAMTMPPRNRDRNVARILHKIKKITDFRTAITSCSFTRTVDGHQPGLRGSRAGRRYDGSYRHSDPWITTGAMKPESKG